MFGTELRLKTFFPFQKAHFVAAGTACDIGTVVFCQEGEVTAGTDVEMFLCNGPVHRRALAFIPEPEIGQNDDPEGDIDGKKLSESQRNHFCVFLPLFPQSTATYFSFGRRGLFSLLPA